MTLQGGQEVGMERRQGHESRQRHGYGGYREPYRYLRWGSRTPNCMQKYIYRSWRVPGPRMLPNADEQDENKQTRKRRKNKLVQTREGLKGNRQSNIMLML